LASLRQVTTVIGRKRSPCTAGMEKPIFSVIWLPTEGETPVLMPDFVKVENGSLLDKVARYNNTLLSPMRRR
jgi:hypothetical protein